MKTKYDRVAWTSPVLSSPTSWLSASRLVATIVLLGAAVIAIAAPAEQVTLQLKWRHQFQFAGYYAALEKGYYAENGLDVRLLEARPETDVVDEVVSGNAQYGIGNSALVLERQHGKPVVALATIFQHSPMIIVGNVNSGITSVQDLKGKRVMLEKHSEELLAYLRHEGISELVMDLVPHSLGAEDMILGQVDAMSGYSTSEPYFVDRAGIAHLVFSPRSVGIDFYGDNLFTSKAELQLHPERVKAFRDASLKGWAYAMDNPYEVAELILSKYNSDGELTRDFLHYEAEKSIPLISRDLVAIGYMHENRWRSIINTYADLGLMDRDFPLDDFLYETNTRDTFQRERRRWLTGLSIALLVSIPALLVATALFRLNRRMKQEMAAHAIAAAELKESEQRFRFMAENTGDVIWIMDIATRRFTYISPSVFALRGYTPKEVMAQPVEAALTPESALRVEELLTQSIARWHAGESANEPHLAEIDQPHKDGHIIHTEVVTTLHADADGKLVSVIGVTRNVTERKRAEEAIRHLAFYDPLTQLPNRRLLQDRVPLQIARARRNHTRLALLFIDLDGFKPVNDRYGHDVGDKLLQAVAGRLKSLVRESDSIARIGGDEFIASLADIERIDDARQAGEKIRSALQEPYAMDDGTRLEISASIGIAIYPDDADSEQELLRLADAAMYKAKNGGRNRVQLLTPTYAPLPDEVFAEKHALIHLIWKPSFACGHSVIDQQHRELFDLANQLFDSLIRRHDPPPVLGEAFDKLIAHVTRHFADEERVLASHGYADLERHAAEHRRLLHTAMELRRNVETGKGTVDELVDYLLSEVVAGHMLHEDRLYFSVLGTQQNVARGTRTRHETV